MALFLGRVKGILNSPMIGDLSRENILGFFSKNYVKSKIRRDASL